MTEHELFRKTFSTLHASPDTLMEVQKAMENNKKTHRTLRRGVVIAIAAALMLTVAAAAGVVHLIKADVTPADGVSDTTLHAFTDDMDASAPTVEGNSGELITVPDMERIPGDVETVQRLVGDYLSKLDAGLTVGSTTITLGTFLIDESGCGILTYAVDDPEGVSYEEAGYGEVYGLPLEPRMYLRSPDYQQGGSINVKLHVDKTTSTATHLDVVAYFAAGETYQKGDNLYFTVYDGGAEGKEPYAVAIQPRTYAPVRTFTAANGETARISAVGITMDNASPAQELTVQELTLHYADGSSYAVSSDSQNLMNWVLGYIYGDGDGETAPFAHAVYIFNRMVDVDTITSVPRLGRGSDSPAAPHSPVQLTYLPAPPAYPRGCAKPRPAFLFPFPY